MSVHAGSILTVGGNNVIDRIQSAGLGDVRVPVEVIREVGNRLVVDKIPGEPDFTFSLETLDVSTDVMAWLCGKVGALATASAAAPGATDPDGTAYTWADTGYVNVVSPWKDPATASAGVIEAGHIVPNYYPTRVSYRYGVTDNAGMTVELGGGAFYYGAYTPIEQFWTATSNQTVFTTSENAMGHRIGGAAGTTFLSVFGVFVAGVPMIQDVDYTVTGGNGAPAVVTLNVGAASGAKVCMCYFTDAAHAYPQTVHASTIVKPGAVRGRHIPIYLGTVGVAGGRERMGGVQSFELEGTVDSEVEREMGSELPVGRVINGRDVSGSITVRAKDAPAFIALLAKITGAPEDEVFGFINQNPIALEVPILNPKDPATVLKTLYVSDAIFQMPGTPARVNAPTDFTLQWDSQNGDYTEYKGAKP